jgi:Multidrug resistance efflux pump
MSNKKGLLIAVLSLSAVFLLVILIWIVPSFSPSGSGKSSVAIVDRGLVYLSVDASGVVEPENEVLILSPVASVIKTIYKEPGSQVQKGEVIIDLDDEQTKNEISQIKDQLEVKSNSLERSRLDAQMTRIDLDYNVEVKKLKIASIKAQLADEEQLLTVGGISSAKIDETKQNLVLAQKDLDMLLKKNTIRLKQLKAEEEGLNLQIEIQKKQLIDKEEVLSKLKIKAPLDGIIMSILGKAGERVGNDKTLISLSDLTTFKIKGSIDEKNSEFVKTGNPVFIMVGGERLKGLIGNVTPSVSDNKLHFNVHLEKNDSPSLISNQNVKMKVLKSLKDNVLRVSSNKHFHENSEQAVYIIEGSSKVERLVHFGMKGTEYQEVISGLKEGEKIETSSFPFFSSGSK